jgi:photosystem II stability/assembly factor-like uncharacterized protein
MKKLFAIIALLGFWSISYAQWMPQASGFTAASRGIQYIQAVDANTVWATALDGSGGNLRINEFTRTTDGGNLWIPGEVLGGNIYALGNISGINATTAWVAVYSGAASGVQDNTCGIYKTTDGGVTWIHQEGPLQGAASFADNVYFWNENIGMCHGDLKDGYFECYTTSDGGITWTRVPQANFSGVTLASGEAGWTGVIEATGTSSIMFGTNKGKIYKSDDYGLHWVASVTGASTAGTFGGVNEIAFKDSDHGLVGYANAAFTFDLYETTDGGNNWTAVTPAGNCYGNNIAYVPGTPNTYVSTGANSAMAGCSYSYDGGHTWTDFDATSGIQFLATAWFNNSTGWAGAFNDQATPSTVGGMYKYTGILTDILHLDPANGGFVIYPNPGNGLFTMATAGFENSNIEVNIYNSTGSCVYTAIKRSDLVSFTFNIDLSELPSGVYFAQVTSGKFTKQEKIIIQ